MTTIRQFALAVFCSTLAVTFVTAQEGGKPKPAEKPATKEPATKEAPKSTFVIATVNGKHEVMNKEAVDAKNKHAAEEHTKAMQAFEKEKQAAEAAHKKFEGKEPHKMVIETTGTEFPTKAAAEEAMKKMEDDAKAAEAKKKEAEKPAPPKK